MKFSRFFAMPNHETFSIKPIEDLLYRYASRNGHRPCVVDPFARNSKWAIYTNDLNPETTADFHVDAVDFMDWIINQDVRADVVLFDPPYSPRQISECYRAAGLTTDTKTTQNGRLYKEVKERLAQCLRPGGIAISCGWTSSGFGKDGFEMIEIMLVNHGAAHNDTIVVVEKKKK